MRSLRFPMLHCVAARGRLPALALALILTAGLPSAVASQGAQVADLPELTSLFKDPLSASERSELAAWIEAHPEVQTRLGDHRTRLLRIGSDNPKGAGGEYRRVVAYYRNYGEGLTHRVSVHLGNGELGIEDIRGGTVQLNSDERREAEALIAAEGRLVELTDNPELVLDGGFYLRSTHADDPCAQNICAVYYFVKPRSTRGPVRRVVVDLSRRMVVHTDLPATEDPQFPPRMTARSAEEVR